MDQTATSFILLGSAFLLGLAADAIGSRTHLPRVTMVLIIGFIVGPACLELLPEHYYGMFEKASSIALTMVGFLLGERLVHSIRGGEGSAVLLVSMSVVVITAGIVFLGLWLIGAAIPTALLLAGIATATDPAATLDVISQTKAKGKFSDLLQGVVAVDDAWGLLAFTFLMTGVAVAVGNGMAWEPAMEGLWELGGAILIGVTLGWIMALVTGRVSKGEPTLLEAVGFVFLCCGISIAAKVSFILAAMVMGAVVTVFAKHYERAFHSIENIELPFMVLFFILAGASLNIESLQTIGWIGVAYVALRIVGRVLGGYLGGRLAGATKSTKRRIGLALMPQAGVALGMALLAEQKFPDTGELILQVTIASTVLFEVVGPLMTKYALTREDKLTS